VQLLALSSVAMLAATLVPEAGPVVPSFDDDDGSLA
jgi:hypothetical protein